MTSEVRAIDAQASALMEQGLRILSEAQPDVAEALSCFDRARELRSRLPIQDFPILRYGLAACWLNRADALMRLRGADQINEALRAYDEAIGLLADLRLEDDERFPRRLAIAHQNRGLALHALGPSNAAGAVTAFSTAIEILDDDRAAAISDRRQLLATAWMNLANVHASQPGAEPLARQAALRAMALVAASEADDADAAEVGLKARHVLCQAIARRLSERPPNGEVIPDDVHEATDAVEDGLRLVRRWEQRDVDRFTDLADDLFRFGFRVYQRYQPQFLGEFVLETTGQPL